MRRAYDALISTGGIEQIEDEKLKVQLAAFYAEFEGLRAFGESAWLYDRRTFEPYLIRELDHVAMLKHLHSSRTENMVLTRSPVQFKDVLGTEEFEGVISGKWHVASGFVWRLESIKGRIDSIDSLIAAQLTKQSNYDR